MNGPRTRLSLCSPPMRFRRTANARRRPGATCFWRCRVDPTNCCAKSDECCSVRCAVERQKPTIRRVSSERTQPPAQRLDKPTWRRYGRSRPAMKILNIDGASTDDERAALHEIIAIWETGGACSAELMNRLPNGHVEVRVASNTNDEQLA